MYLKSNKDIWYQNISDRYYYLNYLLLEGEEKVIKHISSLAIIDIYLVGEKRIDVNNFSNTYQFTYLCAGDKKSSREELLNLFENHNKDTKYNKYIFLKGLDEISKFCDK